MGREQKARMWKLQIIIQGLSRKHPSLTETSSLGFLEKNIATAVQVTGCDAEVDMCPGRAAFSWG